MSIRRWQTVCAASILGLFATAILRAQAPAAQPRSAADAPMSEQVFKNIQILKGIPVDEFMDTMGMIAAAVGMNCTDCHPADTGGWGEYAQDTPTKRTARRMMLMVDGINRANFNGRPVVTCYTCHRGDHSPKVVPSLALQYSAPIEDPNEMDILPDSSAPSVDQIFSKYVDAIGGTERAAGLTSVVATGTYAGYDTDQTQVPVEIYANAPNQRASIVHAQWGDSVRTYDGSEGWVSSADRPTPLLKLTGGNLDGAKVEAILSFPSRIRGAFSRWKVGYATIDDADVHVVQGSNGGPPLVNLYFDNQSSLLVRMVRWTVTPIGTVPTQIDFSDYRDTGGMKIPFKILTTWTNGQSTVELSKVQLNVPVDRTRFARPAPAAPLKTR